MMEADKIEQRQVLVHKNLKKHLETKVLSRKDKEQVVLDLEKEFITVNIYNTAEKIEEYPVNIQKLVWRALHYKCEIEIRNSILPTTPKHYEKLAKYKEAFKQTQKLILKMCAKYHFNDIIIESKI